MKYLKDVRQFVGERRNSDIFVLDCGDIVGNAPAIFPSYIQVLMSWTFLSIVL